MAALHQRLIVCDKNTKIIKLQNHYEDQIIFLKKFHIKWWSDELNNFFLLQDYEDIVIFFQLLSLKGWTLS